MKYMYVVAHPDDEVLGAGGSIHRFLKNKENRVFVIILNADYEKSRAGMAEDIDKSHSFLNIKEKALFSYRNMDFVNENQREMVQCIEEEMIKFQPDYIFTHSDLDLHNDHRVTSICTQQASRLWQRHSMGYKTKGLYFMEVLSSSDWSVCPFKPDTFIEVDASDLYAKINALKSYTNVIRDAPHPRSIENIRALATLRGSNIGYRYAESFKTVWRDSL